MPAHTTVTNARKRTLIGRLTFAQIRANVAGLVPFVLSCPGCHVIIVVECSNVSNVTISTKSPGAKLGPCVRVGSNAPNARKPFGRVVRHRRSTTAERKSVGSAASLSSSRVTTVSFNPKPRKRSVEEEEGEESGGFFDMECREDHHEDDDEPVEESLTELTVNFECRQENGTHEPNLCIVQNEAGEEWIFQGDTTQKDFCEWLFKDDHIGRTVMAHNLQGYDNYLFSIYASKASCTK